MMRRYHGPGKTKRSPSFKGKKLSLIEFKNLYSLNDFQNSIFHSPWTIVGVGSF